MSIQHRPGGGFRVIDPVEAEAAAAAAELERLGARDAAAPIDLAEFNRRADERRRRREARERADRLRFPILLGCAFAILAILVYDARAAEARPPLKQTTSEDRALSHVFERAFLVSFGPEFIDAPDTLTDIVAPRCKRAARARFECPYRFSILDEFDRPLYREHGIAVVTRRHVRLRAAPTVDVRDADVTTQTPG
jgi:hypothetical protein